MSDAPSPSDGYRAVSDAEMRGRLERFEKAIVIADSANDRAFAGQLRVDAEQLRARLTDNQGEVRQP